MRNNLHINNFIASVLTKNYATADQALRKIVQEKLKARFDSEYRAVENQFFGK
jgi:hypothetical protein